MFINEKTFSLKNHISNLFEKKILTVEKSM